jgi:hypothetical protein
VIYRPLVLPVERTMSAPLAGEFSHNTVVVDLIARAVPNWTVGLVRPGSIALISNIIACSIPLCWPNRKGPSGGIGVKPKALPYLAINRTSLRCESIVPLALAQNESSWALMHKLSKHASATDREVSRFLPLIFWLWQFGH